jgi:hypothetical protein
MPVNCVAASAYWTANPRHAAAAANNDPGPGPVESIAELTSGGSVSHIVGTQFRLS